MPQNEFIELAQKRHGRQLDHEEKHRKKEARNPHEMSKFAQKVRGIKAKLYNKKRYNEKAQMKKTINMHNETTSEKSTGSSAEPVPAYLMDRSGVSRSKILSNTLKQKRKD